MKNIIYASIFILTFGIITYFVSIKLGLDFNFPFLIIFGVIFAIIGVYFLYLLYLKEGIYFKFLSDLEKIFKFGKIIFILKLALFGILVSSFFFIFSHPVKKFQTENIEKNGIDIALVLDISESMNSEDLKPTRLEAAKNIISNFLDKVKNDRVGLVVFAGAPFESIPLTFDYNIIKETLKNLSTNTIDQNNPQLNGTAIGDALLMAKNLLQAKPLSTSNSFFDLKSRKKVVILLTDGDANKGVDPILAAKYLAKFGIKVYTIGIGSNQGGYIKYKIGPFTQVARIPPLKTDTLEKIAKITGGVFFRATDNQTLQKIFEQLSKLTKTKIKVKKKVINESMYLPFTLLTTLFLIIFLYFRFREI